MSADYSNLEVLFFDDKKILLKGLQRHFKNDFSCHIATTIVEAMEIFEEIKVDILVSDHQMPDHIGIELLRKISVDKPHVRKILTTSDWHSDVVLSFLSIGIIDGIVYTPITRNVLREEIIAQAKHIIR